MPPRRLLTAVEVGEYLGKSPGSIYQMATRRQIPFVKIGGSTRFDIHAIDAWIKKNSVKPVDVEDIICELTGKGGHSI
jgi:excisionase family DNA binding protein